MDSHKIIIKTRWWDDNDCRGVRKNSIGAWQNFLVWSCAVILVSPLLKRKKEKENWLPLQTNFDQCALTSAAAAWEFGLWAAWGLFSQFVLCCPLDDPVGIIIITIISCDLWERTLQSDRAYTTFFSFSIDDIWENRKLPLYSQVAESLKIKGVNCQI